MKFNDLGLEPGLLSAVAAHGYDTPTPIQAQAIPPVLAGRDLLAGAQTGTGKTAAFVLPLLQLLGAASGRAPRVLILAPTRELAAQILESIRVYGANQKLRARVIFGGVGEVPQIDAMRAGCDIVVATPGRLLDLAERRLVDLSQISHLVLDEADRMLDMGFIHDIRRILKMLPAKRQNLMFSATYTPDIRALASRILVNPVQVEVTPPNSTVDRVVQLAFRVAKDDKRHLLVHLFQNGVNGEGRWEQALVFTRTKHGANRLSQQLEQAGIRSAAIHGNKSQAARTRALADFKAGKLTALVATEVASRGLDIRELPQVVNYDMPHVPEDYVHRIGRTARAGNDGHAVSLVSQDEASLLRDIERTMRQAVPFSPTPEFVRQTHAPLPARPARPQQAPRSSHAAPAARRGPTRRFRPRRAG
jgi:ATP-dependent RNA helicase RhlE